MEKITWIKQILDEWTNLSDKKKVSYITGIIIATLGIVVYSLITHYENKIINLENEKVQLKNEYTISLNRIIRGNDSILSIERERTEDCTKNFIKYVENDQQQVRNILFNYKEYKSKKVK